MSESMPKNYYQQAELNLAKNIKLLKQYNQLSSQVKAEGLNLFNFNPVQNINNATLAKKTLQLKFDKLKSKLQETGDAMVFGPIDWIMYKHQTKQNMQSLGDLVAHCNNGDLICPLRFQFFKTKWNLQHNFDQLDLQMPLLDFIQTPEFEDVVCNLEFDTQWWDNELKKDGNGNTIKWGVPYKY
jgi:hypothetical protein